MNLTLFDGKMEKILWFIQRHRDKEKGTSTKKGKVKVK